MWVVLSIRLVCFNQTRTINRLHRICILAERTESRYASHMPRCVLTNSNSTPTRACGLVSLVYLVSLVCLVCLVHLVSLVCPLSLVQPNKRDKPNKPDRPEKPDEPDQPFSLVPPVALDYPARVFSRTLPFRVSPPHLLRYSQATLFRTTLRIS